MRAGPLCLLLPLVLATAIRAQWREDDPVAAHPDRLLVKLAEGSGARLQDGILVSRSGLDLASVAACFAGADVQPLVTAVSWDELDRWHRHAAAALPPNDRPGHLGLWFRVTAPTAERATALRTALRANPWVATVYHEPKFAPAGAAAMPAPVPTDLPPTTPLLTHLQLTHAPTPMGHGARAVAGVLGARGQGVRVVMLEQSWVLDHEDVSQLVAGHFLGPVAPLDMNYARHGTSGASMICADRNSYGLTGLADEVDMRFIGLTVNGGLENSIAMTVPHTVPGDVVLVVLITLVPVLGPGSWVPVEYFQATFDAVRTVTALGRVVVAAGGNGNLSLDDPVFMNRFNRAYRDSGAILVGASDGAAFARASWANWGSRLDAHSWGEGVAACAYGTEFLPNGDERQAYTAGAQGTSASTPQIGGVVAALQGAARRQLGQPLTTAELLGLLHTHGAATPDVIGLRTDLVAALGAIGAIDGLHTPTPDLFPGETLSLTLDGAPGWLGGLFAASAVADVPVGLNRNAHIDPAQAAAVATFAFTGSTATWSLAVPASATLQGIDLYFQALRLPPSGILHLTNSCQVTVL